MNLIETVKQNQNKIQELQKEFERKSGRKEQLLKQLETDFQVSNKAEAQALYIEMEELKKQNEKSLEEINQNLEEIISDAQSRTVS